MKNKSVRYLLIFLVVLIWGTIGYKVFSYLNSEDEIPFYKDNQVQNVETDQRTDSFQLVANYRDPFLGKTVVSNSQNFGSNNPKIVKQEKPKEIPKVEKVITNWPKLSYQGIIVNQKSKNQTGLLKINGKDYIIHQGTVLAEVEIVKLYNDSVTVKYAGEAKTILKNK